MRTSSPITSGAVSAVIAGLAMTAPVVDKSGAGPAVARSSHIAFASRRDGNWEIYLTDPDGRQQTRLTRRDAQDRFPLWSPDRSKLAFASQAGDTSWELWVMNADGTAPRLLASDIVAKGSRQWSHDGTRILFAAAVERNVEILSVEVHTGRLIRLTQAPGDDRDPSWSPDDRQIAFASTRDENSEIYLMRADGSEPRRLTDHPAPDEAPAWSPDGSKVAFVSARDGDRDVYVIRPDDGHLERLTVGARATRDVIRWSPNGSHIAIQTADHDNYDIQLVRMFDHKRTAVVGTTAYDGQFSWSPDGRRLAFISDRDGFDAVYVTDLSGEHVKRLTATPSLNPEWSP